MAQLDTSAAAPSPGENDERVPDQTREASTRRDALRKLAYAAPVIGTYLLTDTAYAKKDDSKGRGRGRTSPHPPGQTKAPPPPP
jgi:hypothetical protein